MPGERSRPGHDKQGVDVKSRNLVALSATALLSLGLAACGSSRSSPTSSPASTSSSSGGTTISGAGSTLAAPVYSQWGSQVSGVTVNYQAVGSGGGIPAAEA